MEDEEINKQRNWTATIISMVVIVLLGFFAWRIIYFSNLIKTGEVDFSQYSFLNSTSTNIKLASQPMEGDIKDIYSSKAPSLGNKDALVQIIEFADFGCPYSRETSFTIRELAQKYPDKINIVYRDFPITDIHPLAQMAAEAGKCAQDQGRFWEYHDKVYQNQTQLAEESFSEFAQQLNLNIGVFNGCMDSKIHTDDVLADYEDGFNAGVRGTPTFFINGNMIAGAIPKDVFEKIINSFTEGPGL